jgi:glyoxylase-like metal-dependent hydrolase (beta-lactamase superfamily II)
MKNDLSFAKLVADGVYAVDTGFERENFDASYLIVEGRVAAFVDVGTNYSAPRLIQTLTELDLSPNDVRYIILTHIHLDHAGGAGEMMRLCPRAELVVHPRGARHMIDPTALRSGAVAVYGEESVQAAYGVLMPVQASRITEASEGFEISLGQRVLKCLDTAGHAKHHIAIWDARSNGVFTGDTFGLSYREFDTKNGGYVMPTTTPIQFDPIALKDSVERIANLAPDCLFPTHFSRVDDVQRLKSLFLKQLDEMVSLAKALQNDAHRHENLKNGLLNIYAKHLKEHGCLLSKDEIGDFLKIDLELNAQGIEVWLDKAI